MRRTSWMLWLAVLLVPLAACRGPGLHSKAAPEAKPGLALDGDDVSNGLGNNGLVSSAARDRAPYRTNFGAVATLDDVTSGQVQTGAPAERLLVQRGEIQLEVARPEESMARFLGAVKEWGGYLQNQTGMQVTVRLPAKHFDEAFVQLRSYGRVLGESREATDVTEEFTDLGIRIDNARKSLDRLREILQKADKVEDILRIEEQMRRLTEEIERMEGRRKLLADQVVMATLRASFQAVAEAPPVKRSRQPSRFGWINAVGAERLMGDF